MGTSLRDISEVELFHLLGDIFNELRRRGIIRTDSLVAEIGEYWAARLLNLNLVPPVTRGYDATKEGMRYQIKTRRVYAGPRTVNAFRRVSFNRRECDYLVLVTLGEFFDCTGIWEVPTSALEGEQNLTVRKIQDHVSSRKIWPLT